jgi:pantoate--beta-alanine ligase
MRIFETVASYREWRKSLPADTSVGFVPTMGALHAGHAKLLHESFHNNDVTVLSIFVNPTQFNQKEDFELYPKTFEADCSLAREIGVDAIFAPRSAAEMYPSGYRVRVVEEDLSKILCGAHRPGHFDGVLTVVMKLFNIVQPTRAYFGEKDYQQYLLIRRMVEDTFLDLELVPVPTVYEKSGLALSSRNTRIAPEHRAVAPFLHEAMVKHADAAEARRAVEAAGLRVDYLEDRELDGEKRRFAAAWLGNVRLIDNVWL